MIKKHMKKKLFTTLAAAFAAVTMALAVPFPHLGNLVTVEAANGPSYTVSVSSGYLALRNAMAYDSKNEIGSLYNGDTVQVEDFSNDTYWYVYSPKYGTYGYVNRNYLKGSTSVYTVSVSSGYLALRSAKAYSAANEIGALYSGESVLVQDTSDSTYWYVYSSKLGKSGYVNKNYLISPSGSSATYTVKVSSGYLALRSAKAYDSKNEIGALYTGETVEVQDTSDSTYWYVYSSKLGKSGYVNKNYLVGSTPATPTPAPSTDYSLTVSLSQGYLALRSQPVYDDSNEIGRLYNGDTVVIKDNSGSTYWYVYSNKLGKSGYVNRKYLAGTFIGTGYNKTVSVSTGYLALRNAKSYDSYNELGPLYNGDIVQVQDDSDGTYWYVYAPSLAKYGYVNRNYLY